MAISGYFICYILDQWPRDAWITVHGTVKDVLNTNDVFQYLLHVYEVCLSFFPETPQPDRSPFLACCGP